jgi:hypothetical protein
VPYTRGAEVSRPFAAIVDEAKALVDAGAREITLLGQNVNAWVGDEPGQANALKILGHRGSFPATLHFLEPFDPAACADRKAIAAEARKRIATAMAP